MRASSEQPTPQRLTREGMNVVVIDANGIASGTTAAGMGHIVAMDDSDAQMALTKYSQDLWKLRADEMPGNCEFENCGTVWVAANDEEMIEVRRKHEYYSAHGIDSEILDENKLREAEPNLREGLPGGLLVSGDTVVYQLTATKFLIDKAVVNGAELLLGDRVVKITNDGVALENGESISASISSTRPVQMRQN